MKKEYLMIPGPTPVHPDISQEMNTPVFNHRGPCFKELLEEVTEGLKRFFNTQNQVYILTASGSGAMEAGIVNFLSPEDRVVSLVNGAFGERLATIASSYGASVEKIASAFGEPLPYSELEEMLAQDKDKQIKAITVVHNESSTGMMNDVARISKIRQNHPALIIVDAISSLGAVPLPVDDWEIDVCLTGSQKVLMMPPGLSFVSVSRKAWECQKNAQMSHFYFSLKRAHDFYEAGQTPFTPAIPQMVALKKALEIYFSVGEKSMHEHHELLTQSLRAGLEGLGLELLIKDYFYASRTVTAVKAPDDLDVALLRNKLREDFGVEIAGGQGKLSQSSFRIGHLGSIGELDVVITLAAMEMAMKQLGRDIVLGSGVSAAQQVILEKGVRWNGSL